MPSRTKSEAVYLEGWMQNKERRKETNQPKRERRRKTSTPKETVKEREIERRGERKKKTKQKPCKPHYSKVGINKSNNTESVLSKNYHGEWESKKNLTHRKKKKKQERYPPTKKEKEKKQSKSFAKWNLITVDVVNQTAITEKT